MHSDKYSHIMGSYRALFNKVTTDYGLDTTQISHVLSQAERCDKYLITNILPITHDD